MASAINLDEDRAACAEMGFLSVACTTCQTIKDIVADEGKLCTDSAVLLLSVRAHRRWSSLSRPLSGVQRTIGVSRRFLGSVSVHYTI